MACMHVEIPYIVHVGPTKSYYYDISFDNVVSSTSSTPGLYIVDGQQQPAV